ncbi:hypothetical protein F5884DRAFT_811731 [Xylogone sp. PMI_703]|nr:hypothetical protein F5884DRAFT_811731 [Xylogone sp. PMI_703]
MVVFLGSVQMTIDPAKRSRLENLPPEISRVIIDLLAPWNVKNLSLSSKRLREVCLPSLFRSVEFPFSDAGFDGLKSLMKSDARYHVASFTYAVPELLKADILDFNRFKSDLLTPDSYVETAKELYDAGDEADESPSYMIIYEALHDICKEQRSIVDNGVDLSVLSSTFGALPRLSDVGLSFCETTHEDSQLSPFTYNMTTAEESYEYHVRVVSDAIQSARKRGAAIHTISLSGFNLPYYYTWEVPDLSTLSESLKKLLKSVLVLRLSYSNSLLTLLSHCTLNLHQLDMCHVEVDRNSLEDFLETNKRSICSIGFHDVKIAGSGQAESELSGLSSSMLCEMLKSSQPAPCRAADCGCLLFRKEGWRLILNDDHLQRSER